MITNLQIEKLVTDPRFQELKYRQEKTNVFTIVGQTHKEHWHSAFIKWLLDPNSTMHLGHFPLARLLTLCMIKNPECGYTLRDIYSWDLDSINFITEKDASINGKKRSIDIYGESSELVIVIENKVNARENFNNSDTGQTIDYYDYSQRKIEKSGQKAIYVFLTADQSQRPASDKFIHISYQEMYDEIIIKCINHPQVTDEGKYLLQQYASNLREPIHNSNTPMALVNIDLCKELYDDHSETLDGIFALVDKTDNLKGSNEPGCMVYEHYQSVFDEIYLSVDEKFGKSPKANLQRQNVNFMDLYKKNLVYENEIFTMKYDNEIYYAKIALTKDKKKCYIQVLDENKKPYFDNEKNLYMGVFEAPSAAGVAAINFRRKNKGIAERVSTLRGTTYWVNEKGQSILDLMSML